jgi:carbamoyl-phosphate synthase large subunit
MTLPLFVKPRHGRGSIDCFKACNRKELDFFLEYVEEPVVQECLEGREYTIDLLAGFTGEVVSVVPRERISTAAGVSQKGTTVRDPGLIGLAVRVSKALHITGPANIQCFASNRGIGHNTGVELKLVEINPRFAGGYPLSHAAGASFPRLILKMVAGETVTPQIGEFREDLVMLRFDEGVFLHREELVKPEQ